MWSTAFARIASDARLGSTARAIESVLRSAGPSAFVTPSRLAALTAADVNAIKSVLEGLLEQGAARRAVTRECRCGAPLDADDQHDVCEVCGARFVDFPPIEHAGYELLDEGRVMTNVAERASRARFAILTALPHEHVAVTSTMADCAAVPVSGPRRAAGYDVGRFQALGGGFHEVIVAQMPDMGNNIASAAATTLAADFPNVKVLLMVGIAGALPNPTEADHHVRLGDVVVVGREGMKQYDLGKMKDGRFECRTPPRAPSAELLEAAARLARAEIKGDRTWADAVSLCPADFRERTMPDVLCDDGGNSIAHPTDSARVEGKPRVFSGPIASGNAVIKDAHMRDQIRDQHSAKAVEMEGSGIADAAWVGALEYFVVRGTCDYSDKHKNNAWQKHAAAIAAAYCRGLLAATPI